MGKFQGGVGFLGLESLGEGGGGQNLLLVAVTFFLSLFRMMWCTCSPGTRVPRYRTESGGYTVLPFCS